MTTPKVSVIVPMYNAQDYILECVDSVLRQTLQELELICIDDGSFDNTCALVQERARQDKRIRLINQENAGPGVARNAGLDVACAPYVYCLDSDDFIKRDMLMSCVKALEETKADMVLVAFSTYNQQCGRAFPAEWSMRNVDRYPAYPQGIFTWKTDPRFYFETVQNVPWNKMIRRSLLDEYGIRFQQMRLTEDLMYSIPAAVMARLIVRISRPLVIHREFTGTNAMTDKGKYPLDFLKAFYELSLWLRSQGVYDELRLAFQTWLLDAIYYNMPSYRDFDSFAVAYDYLVTDKLHMFDLSDLDPVVVWDHRHQVMLEALQLRSREGFLLACANIATTEVQEQKCGFQHQQTSIRWLSNCLKGRLVL